MTHELVHDPEVRKTGKKRGKIVHPNALALATILDVEQAPTPPATVHNSKGIEFAMYRNDEYGDCTLAGVGNFMRSASKMKVEISDDDVLRGYQAVSGFNPNTGQPDNGAYEMDVLELWRKEGVGGHQIRAHADVANEPDWIKLAAWLFGGLYIGVDLPITAQRQKVWDVDPKAGSDADPGSWGGHCVVIEDVTKTGVVVATWGAKQRTTWAWLEAYCTEVHAVILPEFQARTHRAFDDSKLDAYLSSLKH